jgi:3-phenylpropionate/trans-cinnamate dioxygenase ferredoxin component
MAFTRVATVAEVAPGKAKQVTVNGRKVGLYCVNGSYYAIDDTCTHRGAPLSEGDCEGSVVVCPWHGAQFDVTNGSFLCPPASKGVASYTVQVVGDEIQVDLP